MPVLTAPMKLPIASGVLIIIAVAACDWVSPSVRVHIHNSTGLDILNTRLTIRGQDVLVGSVPSSATRTGVLKPKNESDMTLSFTDGTGRSCRRKVDVYLEYRYRGDLDLFVVGCESMKIEGSVTPSPLR